MCVQASDYQDTALLKQHSHNNIVGSMLCVVMKFIISESDQGEFVELG